MPKPFENIVRGSNSLNVIAADGKKPQVVLIGTVGASFWDDSGITEKEVRSAFKTIPRGTKFDVLVNSEGGSIKEGLGMYNAFKERGDDITCYVVGYALSIASVFPLGAGKVVSPKSAIWMLHESHCLTAGNKRDKTKDAEMLAEHDEVMAEIYAEKTGKPIEEIRAAMEAETWIRGSAAVDFGLADETDDKDDANAAYRPLPAGYLNRCKFPNNAVVVGGRAIPFGPLQFTPAASVPGSANHKKPNSAGAPGGAQKDKLMRDTVIALLKKRGVKVQDDWTDEQLSAELAKFDIIPDNQGDSAAMKEIHALKLKYENERKIRISARVDAFIEEHRLTNDEREDAIARAMADEGYINVVAKRPQVHAGGQSVGGIGAVELSKECPLFDIEAKETDPAKRYEIIKADWPALMEDAERRDRSRNLFDGKRIPMAGCSANAKPEHFRGKVLGTNTYSGTLVTSFLMDGSVTNLQNVWAPLKAFSIDFTTDPYKPLATGVLKHVTAGSTAQTDATNWENGNSTVAPSSVTMHQYSVSFQVSNSDLNSGLRMENLVTVNAGNFANKVIEIATAPIDPAKFTTPGVTIDPANFGYNELRILQALLKKSSIKNLILDGAYMAAIANTPLFYQPAGTNGGPSNAWKAFGWDGVYNNTDWTGAAAKVQGFACHPQAIAGITGLPLNPPQGVGGSGIFSTNTMTVPGLNVTIAVYMWFNPATRTMWTSYDIILGVVEVDTTAGFCVLTP